MKDLRTEEEKEGGGGGGIRGGRGKGERRVLIGLIWPNCAAQLKLFIVGALLLCSLATILQFLPATISLSSCSLRSCLPSTTVLAAANSPSMPPPSRPSPLQIDQLLGNGTLKRSFNPVGTGAYSFIFMSAYRGGAATFSVIGLASKPLHVFGHPTYTCEYRTTTETSTVPGVAILPDWGFGRVYTTVVITCTFPTDSAATDAAGGRLLVYAATNGGFDTQLNLTDTIEALVEPANSWNAIQFTDPPKYDYLYCGSPLYGNLSPQRVREWVAYHVRLFGRRSHFVIYDAGGIQPDVMKVLKPWMELGYLSLHDIREQERFDGYYHNQFLVVNDCLHRYRFSTKWMFFFDVDEYIYVDPKSNDSLRSVMSLYETVTQITISQMLMSSKLCRTEDAHGAPKKWGLEKLVFRDVTRVTRRNRKYAVQPRNTFAGGVHLSLNIVGRSTYPPVKLIRYFHYHDTIALRREPCRQLVNGSSIKVDGCTYVLDTTMQRIAPVVKDFELNTIGSRLQGTQQ